MTNIILSRHDRRKVFRHEKRKQLKINAQLKRNLFKDIFIAPCYYCLNVFLITDLTIEHLIPRSLGGTNEESNITLACAPCNHQRGKDSFLMKRSASRRNKIKNYEQYSS